MNEKARLPAQEQAGPPDLTQMHLAMQQAALMQQLHMQQCAQMQFSHALQAAQGPPPMQMQPSCQERPGFLEGGVSMRISLPSALS
jgi:hypothetical protein